MDLRRQTREWSVSKPKQGGSAVDDNGRWEAESEHTNSTLNRPPVAGLRATSPMAPPKVESSSWANCRQGGCQQTHEDAGIISASPLGQAKLCVAAARRRGSDETHVGGAQHPAALRAEGDDDPGRGNPSPGHRSLSVGGLDFRWSRGCSMLGGSRAGRRATFRDDGRRWRRTVVAGCLDRSHDDSSACGCQEMGLLVVVVVEADGDGGGEEARERC